MIFDALLGNFCCLSASRRGQAAGSAHERYRAQVQRSSEGTLSNSRQQLLSACLADSEAASTVELGLTLQQAEQ